MSAETMTAETMAADEPFDLEATLPPEPVAEAPAAEPRKAGAEPMPEFADLDELTLEEKLALFT